MEVHRALHPRPSTTITDELYMRHLSQNTSGQRTLDVGYFGPETNNEKPSEQPEREMSSRRVYSSRKASPYLSRLRSSDLVKIYVTVFAV